MSKTPSASLTTPLVPKSDVQSKPKSFIAWLCGCCLAVSPEAEAAAEVAVAAGATALDRVIEASDQPPAAKAVEELLVGAGSSLADAAIKAVASNAAAEAKKDGITADATVQAGVRDIFANDALKKLAESNEIGGAVFDAASAAAAHESELDRVAALGNHDVPGSDIHG